MRWTALFCLVFISVAHADLDKIRLINAESDPGWLTHARTYSEDRESPLTQINPDNIADLGLAWYFDTGTKRGLEASPIVIDGVIYTSGSWSKVFANDAVSGTALWSYDPEVPRSWGVNACCDVVNRGVAAMGNRIFFGTIDGRLIALNRETGELDWETVTIDPSRPYTITGAPRVVNDTVIIGNGGAEYGVRGYVSAYDIETGKVRWRFYTVPGNPAFPPESKAMEMAAKTWTGDVYWKVGGGGTVWDSMAYDPDLDLLYIGVGNGSPWSRKVRSPGGGDNLFLSSIVAVNATTGTYVWHYQTTPADNWDYTATQHIILADLEVNGERRKTLMQAPKNGFFYVLDRTNGELISAEKYVPVTWATHVDIETGRPVESETADHSVESQSTSPASLGGHNWQPMAYNSATGLVYIPAMQNMEEFSTTTDFQYNKGGHWNLGRNENPDDPFASIDPTMLLPMMKHFMRGRLIAWDPVEQEEAWRVEHATMWNGGLLTTRSNLVFQGNGSGKFVAYRADTGERVWEHDAGNGIIAPPISYEIDGEQYIAVMAGWGGAVGLIIAQPEAVGGGSGRLLVYKLGGKTVLPASDAPQAPFPIPPPRSDDEESVARGSFLYNKHCFRCHGVGLVSTGLVVDLRYMTEASHSLFDDIVLKGIFSPLGMVSFADVLSTDDADDIHNYIIDSANNKYDDDQSFEWWINTRLWVYDKLGAVISIFL
ncbi:MAG: PQQ-dependent dehydrogenase, methanol/ethanol family [bacterium]